MEMNINSNMHPLGFASNYINYNQLLQDSSLYEEDEEYIRSQFHTDDVLEDQEEFEDMYAEEPQEENRASEPDSESKTKRQTVEEFFRCMICYEKANKPLMCPHCSKFCCSKCFKKWLNEHNGTCPCCRRPIDSKNLVKVRFMSELSDAVNNILSEGRTSAEGQPNTPGVCKEHEQDIKYFCKQCEIPICSDCAMFSPDHKGHEFDHLKNVYDQNIVKLRSKVADVQAKVTSMQQSIRDIDSIMKKLEENKHEKKVLIAQFQKKFRDRLDKEYQDKINDLLSQKKSIMKEYKEFKHKIDIVTDKIVGSNKVDIVLSSPTIENQITELEKKSIPVFKSDPNIFKYSSDKLCADYQTFVLKPFSAHANTDIVFSDPVVINGISWRLKVYPNGNANYRGNYLSVFIEMCKGWPGVVGLYEYKIELVNRKDRTKKTCREHMSEFEATISWGYNRFIKLDALEKEHYLDPEEDLLEFRYYIYPSSEFQLITDLNRYIESLEDNNRQLHEQVRILKDGGNPNDLSSHDSEDKALNSPLKNSEERVNSVSSVYRNNFLKEEIEADNRSKEGNLDSNQIIVNMVDEQAEVQRRSGPDTS